MSRDNFLKSFLNQLLNFRLSIVRRFIKHSTRDYYRHKMLPPWVKMIANGNKYIKKEKRTERSEENKKKQKKEKE